MLSSQLQFVLADLASSVKDLVQHHKLHPVLVNFTAALVPISFASDVLGRLFRRESLRDTAWWTLCFAAAITPLTVVAGWLFWMPDDVGVRNMTIHKWLGSALALVFVALAFWRWHFYRSDRWPHWSYLATTFLIVGALAFQGNLGGEQSFGSMEQPTKTEREDHATGQHDMSQHSHWDATSQPDGMDHGKMLNWQDHIEAKDSK
ncbi:MAG TPA: DUF2231 domain-containing protein [Tepidisphaeraceae bacterium]|jgi:uncharacterized membrane protein